MTTRPTQADGSADPQASDRWQHHRVRSREEARRVSEALAAAMGRAGYAADDVFALRLALDEAVTNALEHGRRGDPSAAIEVRYVVEEGQAMAEVEDQGPGLDPSRVPSPLDPANLAKPGGRGLWLMRKLVSWLQFNERGNRVTLCRRRTSSGAA
jgi:serine/threonine-protein kinase RsbW